MNEAESTTRITRETDAELIRTGEGVAPMFTFRDPDGNPFRVVERE